MGSLGRTLRGGQKWAGRVHGGEVRETLRECLKFKVINESESPLGHVSLDSESNLSVFAKVKSLDFR